MAKNYVFTVNNPVAPYDDYIQLSTDVKYFIFQLEIAPTTGTPHLQGYIQMRKQKTMVSMAALLPGASLQVAHGSAKQCRTYCSKEETRAPGAVLYEQGEITQQGQRKDLEEIKELILKGVSEKQLSLDYFCAWTHNYKAFERFRYLHAVKRNWVTHVIVLTGPTDTGKSRYAHEHTDDAFFQHNGKWFDHYAQQEDVVFDEFYGNRFPYGYLLQLLDRYSMTVETKGGTTNFAPKRIWLISNKNPWEWYNFPIPELTRRISYHRQILDGETMADWTSDVDDAIAYLNTLDQ